MNLSGIVVVVPAAHVEAAIGALGQLPGVEVHHTDRATGRIVVTQQATSVGAEVEGLRRIQALPNVILAEMVYHYFESQEEQSRAPNPVPRSLEE